LIIVCLIARKITSKLERAILTTMYLISAKNTDSWRIRKGDLQCAFHLDVLMVPSSVLVISIDGERLTCGGFSLGETVRLESFEFITDYFSGLSLSSRRSDSGTTFIGSTHSGIPSPQQAMIEDSAEEFHTTSSREGGSGLPSPRRHDMGASPAPVVTTSWMENTPASQAMTTVPLWTMVPWTNTGLPFER
jgi:hypothetical protein